jgi:hypothetical protein
MVVKKKTATVVEKKTIVLKTNWIELNHFADNNGLRVWYKAKVNMDNVDCIYEHDTDKKVLVIDRGVNQFLVLKSMYEFLL